MQIKGQCRLDSPIPPRTQFNCIAKDRKNFLNRFPFTYMQAMTQKMIDPSTGLVVLLDTVMLFPLSLAMHAVKMQNVIHSITCINKPVTGQQLDSLESFSPCSFRVVT
jgi:hypothetical protein